MDVALAAVALAAGAGLVVGWVLTTRRHLDRREEQAADWSDSADKPDLWTSSARCPHCSAHGGLLEVRGDVLEFVCLSCRRRSPRETGG